MFLWAEILRKWNGGVKSSNNPVHERGVNLFNSNLRVVFILFVMAYPFWNFLSNVCHIKYF